MIVKPNQLQGVQATLFLVSPEGPPPPSCRGTRSIREHFYALELISLDEADRRDILIHKGNALLYPAESAGSGMPRPRSLRPGCGHGIRVS